ncbi:MAG: photosynthetic complex assembly protein PuhC [Steroidobacteraceae bacterium]|jgi:putative photosynthetic complex assembly protein
MSASVRADALPSGILIGAALLVGFSLIAATTARLLHLHAATAVLVAPVQVMHLRFVDRSDGAVEVRDADRDDATVHIVPAASNGFLRGVLRGLARARRNEHVGQQPPFTLTRWADGQLTIADPQTGQRLSLEVFGPANSRPFAELMTENQEIAP